MFLLSNFLMKNKRKRCLYGVYCMTYQSIIFILKNEYIN